MDYIFAPKALAEASRLECRVMDEDFFPSDHSMLVVRSRVAGPVTRLPRPFVSPRALMEKASPQQKSLFALEAEAAVAGLREQWSSTPDVSELRARQAELASTIVGCARSHIPFNACRPPRQRARPPPAGSDFRAAAHAEMRAGAG